MVASSLYEHKSVKPTLTLESFEYLKIHEDLKEVVIMKSVPNCIPYSHKCFQIFPYCLAIFPALESDFGIYFKSEFD
jgi:hypothetical protein